MYDERYWQVFFFVLVLYVENPSTKADLKTKYFDSTKKRFQPIID